MSLDAAVERLEDLRDALAQIAHDLDPRLAFAVTRVMHDLARAEERLRSVALRLDLRDAPPCQSKRLRA